MPTPARWHDRGQGAVEYGLLLVLIGVAVIVGLTVLGGALRESFGTAATGLQAGGSTPPMLSGGGGVRPLAPPGATPTP
jgi:pilus assembly protein Flp/PilA